MTLSNPFLDADAPRVRNLFLPNADPDSPAPDGTYTVSPRGDIKPVAKTEGYMVAVKGEEVVLNAGVSWDAVMGYVQLRRDIIDQGFFFGVWTDGGNAYLDLSCWIKDRDAAIRFGIQNDQLAIWDCAASEAINLAGLPLAASPCDTL